MKILIYINTSQNIKNSKSLGGIETLNFDLFNYLKKGKKVFLTNKLSIFITKQYWDVIISSNEAKIFDYLKAKKKIIWFHNKLQIEKAFRKRQFFSFFTNKISAIFVSKYLEKNISKIYPFEKRHVIHNFLDKRFENIKKNFKRELIFTWSVQRSRGLNEVLKLWKNSIHLKNPNAKLYIFGIKKYKSYKKFEKFNIFFLGRVNKDILIKFYKKSIAMICLGFDETFCLNALESMSCGQPVISFKQTALNELVKNGVNGFKVNNYDELEKKMISIIKYKGNKRKLLINNTVNFSKRFYFKNIVNKWEKIINN